MSSVPAPSDAQNMLGLYGRKESQTPGLVRARVTADLFSVNASVSGARLYILVDSESSSSLMWERLASSLKLVRMPCQDFESDVMGVNGQSFRPTGS